MNFRKKIAPLCTVALVTLFLVLNQQYQWFQTQQLAG